MTPSRTYQLLEAKLGEPLAAFVLGLRTDERSWYYIARKLRERTDVSISYETVRGWFADIATTPPGTPRPSTPPQTPKPPSGPGPGRLVDATT